MSRIFYFIALLSVCSVHINSHGSVLPDGKWTIVASYTFDKLSENGLAWNGNNIYFVGDKPTGIATGPLYRFNPADTSYDLVCSIPVVDESAALSYWEIHGLTCKGSHFTVVEQFYDSAFVVEFDSSGTLVSSGPSPYYWITGIAWDGSSFWGCSEGNQMFYHFNPDGSPIEHMNVPTLYPTNLCLQDSLVWVVEKYGYDTITRINKSGDILDRFLSIQPLVQSILFDGYYIWFVDYANGLGTYRLYKADLHGSGTPLGSVPVKQHNFGPVRIDSTSAWNCRIINTGDGDLIVNGISFPSGAPFFTSTQLPDTLTPGAFTDITFTYSPVNEGRDSTIAGIHTNDPVNTVQSVKLYGTGIFNGIRMKLLESSHQFGVKRKRSYSRAIFHVVNTGSEPLTIFSITTKTTGFQRDDTLVFPAILPVSDTLQFGVWFYPYQAKYYTGTLYISSNDPVQSSCPVLVNGTGKDSVYALGSKLWSTGLKSLKQGNYGWLLSIMPIQDINGDTIKDLVLYFSNGVTCCINGNADPVPELLWSYNRWSPMYSNLALSPEIIPDIDGDGFEDIVCGYHNHAVALSGRTGKEIWIKTLTGDISQVNVKYDFNGDDFPDVIANAYYTNLPPFVEGQVRCLNGRTGITLWSRDFPYPADIGIGVVDFTGDGIPDVVGGSGYPYSNMHGLSGINGHIFWQNLNLETGEIRSMIQTDDINNDGIRDFIAGSQYDGYLNYCSSVTGEVLCFDTLGTGGISSLELLDDINKDSHKDLLPSGNSIRGMLYSGINCRETLWQAPFPGGYDIAMNAGDLNNDTVSDIFAGKDIALFINGRDGQLLGSAPIQDASTALMAVEDLTGDTAQEMVIGGSDFLWCFSGKVNKGSLSIGDPFQPSSKDWMIRVFPNPTADIFTLELPDKISEASDIRVEIYGMCGERVLNRQLSGEKKYEFSLDGKSAGIYLIRVLWEKGSASAKIIRQ